MQGTNLSASGSHGGLSLSPVVFFLYGRNARALIDIVINLGFGGGFRGYNASLPSEQKIFKLEEEDQLAEDEIAKIRHEFAAAKQSFFNIPDALKGMPKMDPKGIRVYWIFNIYNFVHNDVVAH